MMYGKIKSFEDLIVWQKAHNLMIDVYRFTESLSFEEKFNRVQQLRRAASSTPANIAEGFGRYHYQENIQFCRQALGSLVETKNHILASRDLQQALPEACEQLIEQCLQARKVLNGYIRYLIEKKAQ